MPIEDVFAGVKFDSAKIAVTGAGDPPVGAIAGTPQPVQGATAGTPQPVKVDPAKAVDPKTTAIDPLKSGEKPAPYDQDPKWKKARAAEAKLQALQEKYGFLDPDELDAEIAQLRTLKGKLGDEDPDRLIEAAKVGKETRLAQARSAAEKARTEGTPDEYAARLEAENQQLRTEMQRDREARASREASQRILQDYTTTADRLITSLTEEAPLAQDEQGMLKLFLGIDNPINTLDLDDKPAIQKELRTNISKFTQFLSAVRQKAVNDYVAGKKPLVPSGEGLNLGSQNVNQEHKAIPKTMSNEDVFGGAKNELAELLLQSAKGIL